MRIRSEYRAGEDFPQDLLKGERSEAAFKAALEQTIRSRLELRPRDIVEVVIL